jgi:hypothetical protein
VLERAIQQERMLRRARLREECILFSWGRQSRSACAGMPVSLCLFCCLVGLFACVSSDTVSVRHRTETVRYRTEQVRYRTDLLTLHILSLRRVQDAADQAMPENVDRCREFLMAGARAGQEVHEHLEPLIEAPILKSPPYSDLMWEKY